MPTINKQDLFKKLDEIPESEHQDFLDYLKKNNYEVGKETTIPPPPSQRGADFQRPEETSSIKRFYEGAKETEAESPFYKGIKRINELITKPGEITAKGIEYITDLVENKAVRPVLDIVEKQAEGKRPEEYPQALRIAKEVAAPLIADVATGVAGGALGKVGSKLIGKGLNLGEKGINAGKKALMPTPEPLPKTEPFKGQAFKEKFTEEPFIEKQFDTNIEVPKIGNQPEQIKKLAVSKADEFKTKLQQDFGAGIKEIQSNAPALKNIDLTSVVKKNWDELKDSPIIQEYFKKNPKAKSIKLNLDDTYKVFNYIEDNYVPKALRNAQQSGNIYKLKSAQKDFLDIKDSILNRMQVTYKDIKTNSGKNLNDLRTEYKVINDYYRVRKQLRDPKIVKAIDETLTTPIDESLNIVQREIRASAEKVYDKETLSKIEQFSKLKKEIETKQKTLDKILKDKTTYEEQLPELKKIHSEKQSIAKEKFDLKREKFIQNQKNKAEKYINKKEKTMDSYVKKQQERINKRKSQLKWLGVGLLTAMGGVKWISGNLKTLIGE